MNIELFFQQKVMYEWRPSVCTNCKRFRHLKQECREGKTEKLIWKLKSNSTNESGIGKHSTILDLERQSKSSDLGVLGTM